MALRHLRADYVRRGRLGGREGESSCYAVRYRIDSGGLSQREATLWRHWYAAFGSARKISELSGQDNIG